MICNFGCELIKEPLLTFYAMKPIFICLLKDDADAVQKQALASFERIAKEGRKYGVSIVVVSQRPSDVSRTILSQCNNFLSLRLTNDRDQAVVKRLMPDSLAGLTEYFATFRHRRGHSPRGCNPFTYQNKN